MNFIVNFLFLNFNTHVKLPHFSKKISGLRPITKRQYPPTQARLRNDPNTTETVDVEPKGARVRSVGAVGCAHARSIADPTAAPEAGPGGAGNLATA